MIKIDNSKYLYLYMEGGFSQIQSQLWLDIAIMHNLACIFPSRVKL